MATVSRALIFEPESDRSERSLMMEPRALSTAVMIESFLYIIELRLKRIDLVRLRP